MMRFLNRVYSESNAKTAGQGKAASLCITYKWCILRAAWRSRQQLFVACAFLQPWKYWWKDLLESKFFQVHRVSVRTVTNRGQSKDQQCTILIGKGKRLSIHLSRAFMISLPLPHASVWCLIHSSYMLVNAYLLYVVLLISLYILSLRVYVRLCKFMLVHLPNTAADCEL